MLLNEIKNRIQSSFLKRIPFSEYMALALYHPKWGYYNQSRQKIGREGDFYTSSSVGKIYGVMWAKHFVHTWRELGFLDKNDTSLILLEVGGGNGDFARAVLDEFYQNYPQYYQRIYYYMNEQSAYHRSLQKDKLHEHHEHILWFDQLSDIISTAKGKPSIIFSNELFDALPVDRLKRIREGYLECWIEIKEEKLTEVWVPLERDEILDYLEQSNLILPEGYILEVSLEAKNVYRELVGLLEQGYLFTIDYGWLNHELLWPERKDGTLMGYYNHQHVSNYYEAPGDIDLTSHVHFDDLIAWGKTYGVEMVSYQTQREWLMSENIFSQLQGHQDPNPFGAIAKQNRAILQLISPGGMGDTFKVLIQKRSNTCMK